MPEKAKGIADDRVKLIRRAALSALLGNAVLAASKIAIGLLFRSLAVVGDGIDSSTDVVIAVMSLAVASVIARPADTEHPWGHARAETMATTALSFILFFAGAQLILTAVRSLASGKAAALPELPALIVTVVSIFGKAALALSQYALGKKAGSSMLMANGTNMRNDVLISSGVLAGLLVAVLGKVPAADAVAALLVGAWVVKSAFGIFRGANLELMDGTDGKGPYRLVFEAARSVPGVDRPHRARMRRIATTWDIDLDIEVDGKLNVREAHALAERVEREIKNRIPDVYDIVVHVEPTGIHNGGKAEEAYGLSESILAESEEKK